MNGLEVVGHTNVAYETVIELLGVPLKDNGGKRQCIKVKWLRDHYKAFTSDENSPEEVKLMKIKWLKDHYNALKTQKGDLCKNGYLGRLKIRKDGVGKN